MRVEKIIDVELEMGNVLCSIYPFLLNAFMLNIHQKIDLGK